MKTEATATGATGGAHSTKMKTIVSIDLSLSVSAVLVLYCRALLLLYLFCLVFRRCFFAPSSFCDHLPLRPFNTLDGDPWSHEALI